jgi:predicted nucleotidyltransferase component of viral defense system
MASSPDSPLTALQKDVLAAFFGSERGFFLTGGAALAGYWLRHRPTSDLDLFTLDDGAFERAPHVLREVVVRLGGSTDVRQDAPGFRRFAVSRGDDAVVVDLVRERVKQLHDDKRDIDGVLVDPPDEILANKLTALVGRQEERDIVDVMLLERDAKLRIEDFLPAALAKDGGCTPATLAWLLSELRIDDKAPLPAGTAPETLRAYVSSLVDRLRRTALPER